MFKHIFKFLAAGFAVMSMTMAPTAQSADSNQEKVVYHINDSANASALLRNVRNHLSAAPGTKIAVVGHGKGIDFMLKDAQDDKGNPYAVTMETLSSEGVDFKVCNNTLNSRKLTAEAVAYPAKIVPSGVAEIGRLQAKEGYVYLKP